MAQLLTNLNTEQAKWVCTLLERECSECGGIRWHPLDGEDNRCDECKGTGRIPLLAGVRTPCNNPYTRASCKPPIGTKPEMYPASRPHCNVCHGLGYRPAKEMWKWWDTAMEMFGVGFLRRIDYATEVSVESSFYAALTEACKPLACNGDEVITWVKGHVG